MLVKLGRNSKISKFSFSSLIYHFWEKITKMITWVNYGDFCCDFPKNGQFRFKLNIWNSSEFSPHEVKFQNHPSKDPSFRWISTICTNSFSKFFSEFMSLRASCSRFFSIIVFLLIFPAGQPLISGISGSMLRQVSGIKYLN